MWLHLLTSILFARKFEKNNKREFLDLVYCRKLHLNVTSLGNLSRRSYHSRSCKYWPLPRPFMMSYVQAKTAAPFPLRSISTFASKAYLWTKSMSFSSSSAYFTWKKKQNWINKVVMKEVTAEYEKMFILKFRFSSFHWKKRPFCLIGYESNLVNN